MNGHIESTTDEGRACCRCCTFTKQEVLKEIKKIISLAWPTSAYLLLYYGINFTSIIFNGHLGKTELATASISVAVIGATVRAIGVGFTSACETFFAQTYGSENKLQVGIELQKSILCMFIVMVLAAMICLNAEMILVFLGQDPNISASVGLFLTLYIPGIPAEMLCMILVKYLQCQCILLPIVVILVIINIINIGCHYLLMIVFGMGLKGSPLALVITLYSLFFLLIAFIYFKGIYKTTWSGWSWKCLEGWGKFYKLGVAGSLMVSFEWWSFEVGLFLAGLLGETAIGVQSVLFHLTSMAYMVPLGISIATSVRVGNNLGANQPRNAHLTSFSALIVCWIFAAMEAIFFLSLKNHLGYLFTNDQDILDQSSSVIPLFALLVFFDNSANCFGGIIRGTGHQVLGAALNLIGFYIMGLPASVYLLFFTQLQIFGYWMGQTFALFSQSVMFAIFVCNINWSKEAKRALKKAGVLGTVILPTVREQETDLGSTTMTQQELLGHRNSSDFPKDRIQPIPIGSTVEKSSEVDTPMANLVEVAHDQFVAPEPSLEDTISTNDSFQFILLKRLLLLVFCLCLLLAGILCRLFVVYHGAFILQGNDTSVIETFDTATIRYSIDND